MIYHNETAENVIKELESNPKSGLTRSQVAEKLAEFGPNKLHEKKKKTMLKQETWQNLKILKNKKKF